MVVEMTEVNPVTFNIHVSTKNRPHGMASPEDISEDLIKTALRMVEDVKKAHPDARISVEVEA